MAGRLLSNGYVAHLRNPLKGFRPEYQRSPPDSGVFDSLKLNFVWCSDWLFGGVDLVALTEGYSAGFLR
jgi:hypothetical protein